MILISAYEEQLDIRENEKSKCLTTRLRVILVSTNIILTPFAFRRGQFIFAYNVRQGTKTDKN